MNKKRPANRGWTATPTSGPSEQRLNLLLNVVVQRELVRMRPQPDGVRFVLALVVDECLDQLLTEHIALRKEAVIVFEAIQRLLERRRHGWHILHLFGREIVDVLVERLAGL